MRIRLGEAPPSTDDAAAPANRPHAIKNSGGQHASTRHEAVLKRKAAQRVTIPFFNRIEGQRANPNRSGGGFYTQSK